MNGRDAGKEKMAVKCDDKKEIWKKLIPAAIVAAVFLAVVGVLKPGEDFLKNEQNPEAEETAELQTEPEKSESDGKTGEKKEPEVTEPEERRKPVELVEKEEASYEEWLAAAAVMAVSMQYSEFSIPDIYLASETEIGNKSESGGVYLHFISGEEEIFLEVKPLGEERTETGTRDLYTEDLGFATFDEAEGGSTDMQSWKTVLPEDLERLIVQSLLVTVYEH